MYYTVEAQIIAGKPRLRVLHTQSGRVCLQWDLVQIEQMFEAGEIKKDEFLQPDRYGMKLLVKNLFLIACVQNLHVKTYSHKKTLRDNSPASKADCQESLDWLFNYQLEPKV